MKIFLGVGTIILLIFLTGIAQAKDKIVTSEKLSISDVQPTIEKLVATRKIAKSLKTIIGIHQNGNKAYVYYVINPILKDISSKQSLVLERLNSGKWLIQGGGGHMIWEYLRK